MAESLRERATCRLEARPFAFILETRNRNQFAMVEPDERCIDHVFRRHHDFRRQLRVMEARSLPKISRRRAWQHSLNADTFVGEFVLQGMAQRKDKRLRRAVPPLSVSGEIPTIDPMLMIAPVRRSTKAGAAA